ncbi:unnamed protein product [Arabidopsis lyrata]|uniref:Predicted protein n=1 Tax=Arabidopsis lyrata subsp. lyrata TaxID=81972 RepID=D7KPZ3_ARALL|nr:predicted protein [Arabidopsis lyrata subsp. lyrata]CAH8256772.1 unnamed protein product [Arabidopsis lyrata]
MFPIIPPLVFRYHQNFPYMLLTIVANFVFTSGGPSKTNDSDGGSSQKDGTSGDNECTSSDTGDYANDEAKSFKMLNFSFMQSNFGYQETVNSVSVPTNPTTEDNHTALSVDNISMTQCEQQLEGSLSVPKKDNGQQVIQGTPSERESNEDGHGGGLVDQMMTLSTEDASQEDNPVEEAPPPVSAASFAPELEEHAINPDAIDEGI